jgi:predicted small secreted protein
MITSHTSPKTFAAIMFAAAVAVVTLSACNTIEGVGQDVGSVGGAVEDAADDNKKN